MSLGATGENEFQYYTIERIIQGCIIGDKKVGKTTIIRRLSCLMNTLSGDIRDDSINKVSGIYSYQELSIGIRLFDYPRLGALDSDEIFQLLTDMQGVIFVCDINDKESIATAARGAECIRAKRPELVILLVFNKDDGDYDRLVPTNVELQAVAAKSGSICLRCSAKENYNMEDLLFNFVDNIVNPNQQYMKFCLAKSISLTKLKTGESQKNNAHGDKKGCSVM
ncbi:Ras-related protein [Giardia duodenalis]|uniref:Ras-related protein n=1 Tax=Giardia intestinalis (strain ATCC 50803 / WB clone C6) TaxID=184922 RepID=A8B5M4_GIAIC|nr:RAS-related [Giardia intestinalis]KAE8305146.1 Ras-related protein [Giardia intestinalis]|eukprot:XP_001709259.1 RAS-related [Giardia lamblia ATCC 50803]